MPRNIEKKKKRLAADMECAWSTDWSLKDVDSQTFSRDERSTPMLLSMRGSDGSCYVGDPFTFDYSAFDQVELIFHNASFDQTYLEEKAATGILNSHYNPARVLCSADLAAYCQYPRTLAGAIFAVFGETVSKEVRDNSRNKTVEDLKNSENYESFLEYGQRDADLALRLFNKLESQWPEHERRLSEHTRGLIKRGLRIDTKALKAAKIQVKKTVEGFLDQIPWYPDRAPTSKPAFDDWCASVGIPHPTSTAKTNASLLRWKKKYPQYAYVPEAMQGWRSANALLGRLETLGLRIREDGRVPVQLKYCGAHTLRWSGSGGFNWQNLTREETFGVDLRGLVIPKEGHKFVVCDLSQIEPRVLHWLAEDERMLKALRAGVPLYQAHAEATMNWTGGILKKEAPEIYRLAKARVLGLGYKLEKPETLVQLAKSMAGLDLTVPKAAKIIEQYALQNPKIVEMWDDCEKELNKQVGNRKFVYGLQSKRDLVYHNFRRAWREGQYYHGFGHRMKANVQVLCENLVQATARDLFGEMILNVEDAGFPVVLHVHDEIVVEIHEDRAEDALAQITEIMSTPPSWADDLPVAAEGAIFDRYGK